MIETNWAALGRETASKLKGITDEDAIANLGQNIISKIYAEKPTARERKNAFDSLSKPIRDAFPNYAEKPKNPLYRATGKSAKRWRHLIFDYLTLSQADYDEIDPSRKDWRGQQLKDNATAEITVTQLMNISQLELDTETQKMVSSAISRNNVSLPDFIKKACMVYAKTLVKKAEVSETDLAGVSTEDLLDSKKYQTHPGRAPELTKRAVIAIKKHNASVPETEDRWHITQSAITRLTGSRPGAIAKALEQFQDDIREMEDIGLNAYSNRKGKDISGNPREIENEINLVELVPDGYTD